MKQSNTSGAALITGSAKRLGREIALMLAEHGFDIVIHYHSSEEAAADTATSIKQLGRECTVVRGDLGEVAGLAKIIEEAFTAMPHLNLLVNCASGYKHGSIAETTVEMFDEMMNVNLRAPFFLTQYFAERAQNGHIVNVLDNKIGFNQNAYAAYLLSKKSLADFTKMAALEFAPGIRVNGVSPGVTLPGDSRTDEYIRWRVEQGIPLKRKGDPAEIGRAILYLHQNDFITGQIVTVDGGETLKTTGLHAVTWEKKDL